MPLSVGDKLGHYEILSEQDCLEILEFELK
jgi:hypothetical protein